MQRYVGLAASEGIAVGPALIYQPASTPEPTAVAITDIVAEMQRVRNAIDQAQSQLKCIYDKSLEEVGEETAAIFLAHQEFLEDPGLLDAIKELVENRKVCAEAAIGQSFETYAGQLEALEDEYYRERAADLRDVSNRVRRILAGVQDQETLKNLASPVVVVARDLTPSDTAQMNKKMVLGFCTATGGLTSHTAIMARILSIPAVVGIGQTIMELATGTMLAVDGQKGVVIAEPDEQTVKSYALQQKAQAAQQAIHKAAARKPAATRDGHHVEVVANIADDASAEASLEFGAEGVGLFRTEFLFLNRTSVPTEEEQYKAYRAVADVMRDRPLIIRTLDIGGDKQLPYLDIGQEMNPFLGWRAIRLVLDRPDVFDPQLKAILRAAVDRNVLIMFPMVATVEELRRARHAIERAMKTLGDEGKAYNSDPKIGIMVEIPSAAVMADVLAKEVDFFSIGTNDLIQYTLACDRVNERVSYLYEPLHPAVLRLIKGVIDASHHAGKWTGMCGEMAGDLEAIPVLLGMGLDEFSMNAPAIPAAKALIGSLTRAEAQAIAQEALSKPTASEVREYLRSLGLARKQ